MCPLSLPMTCTLLFLQDPLHLGGESPSPQPDLVSISGPAKVRLSTVPSTELDAFVSLPEYLSALAPTSLDSKEELATIPCTEECLL